MTDTNAFEKELGLDKPDHELRAHVAKCFGVPDVFGFGSAYEQKLTPRDRGTGKRLLPIAKAARKLEEKLLDLDLLMKPG